VSDLDYQLFSISRVSQNIKYKTKAQIHHQNDLVPLSIFGLPLQGSLDGLS